MSAGESNPGRGGSEQRLGPDGITMQMYKPDSIGGVVPSQSSCEVRQPFSGLGQRGFEQDVIDGPVSVEVGVPPADEAGDGDATEFLSDPEPNSRVSNF